MQRIFLFLAALLFLISPFTPHSSFAAAAPAPVPQTGQTLCYNSAGTVIACAGTGQDGDEKAGVAWPNPRFTDNGNGTVTDNLSGLIWLKNANCFNYQVWATAITSANALASGACGLTDGSTAGQWRLPTIRELRGLVDKSRSNPALPAGHPFTSVQSNYYWSATTGDYGTFHAWVVSMTDGGVPYDTGKANDFYVWPVRSGQ